MLYPCHTVSWYTKLQLADVSTVTVNQTEALPHVYIADKLVHM